MLRSIILLLLLAHTISGAQVPTCAAGFTLISNKCLKLFSQPEYHATAAKNCQNFGATLATIKSDADSSAVAFIAGTDAPLVWIGLSCFDNVASNCYWDDFSGPVTDYNKFATGFPNTDIGQCTYYSDHGALAGKWVSGDCKTLKKPYVCELPTTFVDSCQNNFNGFCYTLHDPLPFAEAQAACEQECGNLASIHSYLESFYLSRMTSKDVFIGASYASPDILNWIDGTPRSYSNLDPNLITSDCLIMSKGSSGKSIWGMWYGKDCKAATSFICKRPAGMGQCDPSKVTVSPAPTNPSQCNGDLLVSSGYISSPNYPYPYGSDVSCTYRLSTLGSYNVLLRFLSFSTQPNHNEVSVYDGDSTDAKLLGNYGGYLQPFSVVSTGSTMTVTFKTAGNNEGFQGFQARFTSYSY